MGARRWFLLIVAAAVVAMLAGLFALPEVVRTIAIARVHALTQRPVSIERVDLNLLNGGVSVHGFRLDDREGATPLAAFRRLDLRVNLLALLRGHLWLRDLVLSDSAVNVVRLPTGGFNISDLLQSSGSGGRSLDVTVDHLAVLGGTVTLEDRALAEPRTWRSESITIEARNLSTRREDGRATGRSVTAGAPVSVEVTDLRLAPIRLHAVVAIEGADLTAAQVYLPADTPMRLDRGRMSTSVTVALDAHEGLRADGTARLEDVAVVSRDGGQPLASVPRLTAELRGFAFQEARELRLAHLAVDGALGVRDPRAKDGRRSLNTTIRAGIADLTWPATTPGRLDVLASVADGGTLALTGTVKPPPAASQLRLRLARLDVAPWAQLVPVAARLSGMAEADLRIDEPLQAGLPANVQGVIAINQLGVGDGRREVVGARRLEASGVHLHGPSRLVVDRVTLTGPRGTLERDRAGSFPVKALFVRPASSSTPAISSARPAAPSDTLAIGVGEILVRDGALAWRDETTSPAARLDLSGVNGRITGIGWPLRGPAVVRMALRPPGSGQVQVTGRIGLDPLSAELHVATRQADLAPYQPYLPLTARLAGSADLDVDVAMPSLTDGRVTARGSAAVSRMDLKDGERTLARAERAQATGLDVQWPERVAVARLALIQPWIVIERDERGGLPLRGMMAPATVRPSAPVTGGDAVPNGAAPAVTVSRLSVEDGGMRVVDRAVSPAFAVDLQSVALQVQGVSTASDHPARLDLHARLGPGADITLRGTLGALSGPLHLDLAGQVRDFAMPRVNPYVLQQAGWKTTEGRLTSNVRARVEGDALSARTDIRLSRLQLVRAAPSDGAQARIGLPLNMLSALMKDRHGDITLSFPVGGRLGDPRFDFSEAIWSAIRTVAVKAITLPVSWIGRVKFTPDSRIDHIEVDPVLFQPGASTPTAEGQAQAVRLAAFLDQLPEVRMTLTPVLSSRDVAQLKRRAVDEAVERLARERRLPREAAAARLLDQVSPGPAPDSLGATLDALAERQAVAPAALADLAAQRVEAVRATVKQNGGDPARLVDAKVVQREGDAQVALNVVAPETERPSRLRDALRRLGVPLQD